MTGELMDHHHGGGSSSNATTICGWGFIVLMSRQGKIRLSEFFASYTESEKRRILRDIAAEILPRAPKMCNIIEQICVSSVCVIILCGGCTPWDERTDSTRTDPSLC